MKISQTYFAIKDGSKFLMITLVSSQKSLNPNISVPSVDITILKCLAYCLQTYFHSLLPFYSSLLLAQRYNLCQF